MLTHHLQSYQAAPPSTEQPARARLGLSLCRGIRHGAKLQRMRILSTSDAETIIFVEPEIPK